MNAQLQSIVLLLLTSLCFSGCSRNSQSVKDPRPSRESVIAPPGNERTPAASVTRLSRASSAQEMLSEFDAVDAQLLATDKSNSYKVKAAAEEAGSRFDGLAAQWKDKIVTADLKVVFVQEDMALLAAPVGATWLVVDGYHFKPEDMYMFSSIVDRSMMDLLYSRQGFIVVRASIPSAIPVERARTLSRGDTIHVAMRIVGFQPSPVEEAVAGAIEATLVTH